MKEVYIVLKDLGQDGWVYDEYEANIGGYHEMIKYLTNDIPAINRDEVRVFKGVELKILPQIIVKDVELNIE